MLARFFYGYGEEITFYDRQGNGENPVTDEQRDSIETFLIRISAKMGFYQINGDDVSTLTMLKEYKPPKGEEYEEWCPHCGGCTTYDTVTESIQCMWCGMDLLPCSQCREYRNKNENEKCNFNAETHSCRVYQGRNRLPDFYYGGLI
jgi:hypothetical protein